MPKASPGPVREAIRAKALAMGFDAVGFAPAQLAGQARADLREFLDRGYHGDMGWLAATAERRGDPQTLWPDARSVVVLGLNYADDGPHENAAAADSGEISVYARGRDYHDLLKKRLKALARWVAATWPGDLKVFVDTAPVMEKPLAQLAGLGWQGKHTNLVSRAWGSWLFLGEVFLSIDLPPDKPEHDHCGVCRRCLDVCPTAAFPAPYQLDARRCISYLTIEHKGPIPHALRPLLGNHIFGCDDCLAVCPWNKFARSTGEPELMPRDGLTAPRLAGLAMLDDAGFRTRFAGTAVKRIGRDRFLRNVLIAIGNASTSTADLVAAIRLSLDDPSPLVRGAAVWAFARLMPRAQVKLETSRRSPGETDPQVREEWRLACDADRAIPP